MEGPFPDIAVLSHQQYSVVIQHIRAHEHVHGRQAVLIRLIHFDSHALSRQGSGCRGFIMIGNAVGLSIKAVGIIFHSTFCRICNEDPAVCIVVIICPEANSAAAAGMLQIFIFIALFEIELSVGRQTDLKGDC